MTTLNLDEILDALTSANPRWCDHDTAEEPGDGYDRWVRYVQAWPVSNTSGNTRRDDTGPCVWRVMFSAHPGATLQRLAYGAAPSMAEAMDGGKTAAAGMGY